MPNLLILDPFEPLLARIPALVVLFRESMDVGVVEFDEI